MNMKKSHTITFGTLFSLFYTTFALPMPMPIPIPGLLNRTSRSIGVTSGLGSASANSNLRQIPTANDLSPGGAPALPVNLSAPLSTLQISRSKRSPLDRVAHSKRLELALTNDDDSSGAPRQFNPPSQHSGPTEYRYEWYGHRYD